MDTKEAIKWIFDIWHEWENVYGVSGEQVLKEGKKMDEVIELLQRGEKLEGEFKKLEGKFVEREAELYLIIKKTRKYKKMWKELHTFIMSANHPYSVNNEMGKIKKKYFPKEEVDNDKTEIS